MTNQGLDAEYFEQVLTTVDNHEGWNYSESNEYSVSELAGEMEERRNDGVFEPVKGEGLLKLRNIYGSSDAMTGHLVNPLGPSFTEPEEDSFAEGLGEAYSVIVGEQSSSDYVDRDEAENDVIYIATLGVPEDYDEDELVEALDDVDRVNREVNTLHDDLHGVVNAALEQ